MKSYQLKMYFIYPLETKVTRIVGHDISLIKVFILWYLMTLYEENIS